MSDEVITITTAFGDVAELGQGYMNRADGERILLPLSIENAVGDGVRFIVQLVDGTPAFAGAGRCVQASDQGDTVAAEERFETLLDNLAFDDRSRPVYEYIVAVRQAVYAAGGGDAQAQPGEADAAAAADAADDESTAFVDSSSMQAAAQGETEVIEAEAEAESASMEIGDAGMDLAAEVSLASVAPPSAGPLSAPPRTDFEATIEPTTEGDTELASAAGAAYAQPEASPAYASVPATAAVESLPPMELPPVTTEPLPTGMLKRPALAAHWQPAAPQPPRATKGTGLFRYAPGTLPVPAQPPRPQLDPSQWVQPAAAPAS